MEDERRDHQPLQGLRKCTVGTVEDEGLEDQNREDCQFFKVQWADN